MNFSHLKTKIHSYWNLFWFTPESVRPLAYARSLFFGYLLIRYWDYNWQHLCQYPKVLWNPPLIFKWLHLPPANSQTLELAATLLNASLLFSALGLWTRLACALSFVLSFYLFGLLNSFGRLGHAEMLAILTMGVLVLSRSGDYFSIDRWWHQRVRPNQHSQYRWPIQLIRVLLVHAFFLAGLSKLRESGWEWATDSHLHYLFLKQWMNNGNLSEFSFWLGNSPELMQLAAASVLTLELVAPLALFIPRLSLPIFSGLLLLQIGNAYLLGIHHWSPSWACYAFCFLGLRKKKTTQPESLRAWNRSLVNLSGPLPER